MSETGAQVHGVVFAHGRVAEALVRAVEDITGIRGALSPLSNEQIAPEVMGERLLAAAGEGPTIIFTDLRSSSCSVVARRVATASGRWAIVCGANLPMLLDFVFHRELGLEELVSRLVERGKEGVMAVLEPEARGDRTDPR
ncbi:MAG: hypothetical protein R3E10_02110 [Gemmatimonadota bacterium]